jgi:hypothetical protein
LPRRGQGCGCAQALLLFAGSGSAALLTGALLAQFAGVLAGRWYLFGESRPPQNLYYQAIA